VLKIILIGNQFFTQKKFSAIHCRSYLSALIGLGFYKKHQVPFLFDMRGFWADERVDGKLWDLTNPLYKLVYQYFKRKEKQFVQKSAAIISLTHAGKNEMLQWGYAIDESKISVIPCCVDTNHFNSENVSENTKVNCQLELGISPTDFVISYLGSIGTWYLLPEMLDFFKVLQMQQPTAKFLFITQDDTASILELALHKGIEKNAIIFKNAQRAEVPALISICHYSLFFIMPSYSKLSSSPTKQAEIMAMGVPVVCNAGVGDTQHIVEQYHSGLVVKEFTNDEYIKIAKQMLQENFIAKQLQQHSLENFSLAKGVEQYAAVYKKMVLDIN
jgi:glycosyltransferase involved in cell wall biosynthesis